MCIGAALLVVGSIGCHAEPRYIDGVVRFDDGEPVQSGAVEFRSLADGRRYAGRILPTGAFRLSGPDGDLGCPAGEYEVVVVQIVLTEDLAAEDHRHGRTVPRRYADYYTSGLKIGTPADPTQPIEIVLKVK